MAKTAQTIVFTGVTATIPSIQLFGGRYSVAWVTGTGSYHLDRLLPDGVSWFTFQIMSASQFQNAVDILPPGTYRIFLASGPDTGSDFELVSF